MSNNSLKVLICDDSILIRKKLMAGLELCGSFEILEAEDGQKSVDIYKENKPDIVFMDIVMPLKDGITAVEEIRAFDENAKIIMVSSSGTDQNLRKAIKAGAFDFIQKPWEHEYIKKIISNFLKEEE